MIINKIADDILIQADYSYKVADISFSQEEQDRGGRGWVCKIKTIRGGKEYFNSSTVWPSKDMAIQYAKKKRAEIRSANKIADDIFKSAAITQLDREAVRLLREEIGKALEPLEARHGIKIDAGNATFSPTNLTLKINVSVRSSSGEILSREAQDFKAMAGMIGMKPEDLGKTVRIRGDNYTIIGYKRSSREYPILVQRADGKVFKLSVDSVKNALYPNRPAERGMGLTEEIKRKFEQLSSRLSPENLYADGERSQSEAMRLKAQLMREWRELERQAGVSVSESDVYDFNLPRWKT